jgi:hypothetical protein
MVHFYPEDEGYTSSRKVGSHLQDNTACTVNQFFYDDKIKEYEMGGACSAHGGYEKCVQNFGWNA